MSVGKERRTADLRLQRTYGGFTLAEYEQRFEAQGRACAICKRPPFKYRLNVDHDHRFDRIKVVFQKLKDLWIGCARLPWRAWDFTSSGPIRRAVREVVRRKLRYQSIRGLLCMQCNKGLQYFRDSPERLENAAAYLRRFNELYPAD